MHSRPGANQIKKCEESTFAAVVQPTPKWDSVTQHWWENRSAKALDDEQRRLLKELTGPDGVIGGNLKGLIFPRWRARRHPAENLFLQYAKIGCRVLVGRDWTQYEMEAVVTKVPHSSELENDTISKIQV